MTFQFTIQLLEVESPKVWRKVLVPGNFTFHKFHQVIQSVFGWYDIHLYEFSPKGLGSYPIITNPDSMPDEEYTNSKKYRLSSYFDRIGEKMIYTYDYGDCWEHQITLDKVVPQQFKTVTCIGGEGACPPEDCGGPDGFNDFKLAVNDPTHEHYAATREWNGVSEGEVWDVHEADPEIIMARLEMYKL